MTGTEMTLDSTMTDALAAPGLVADAPATATTATTAGSAMWTVLLGGAALTALAMGLGVVDTARADGWELTHWNLSALAAALATGLSIRGSHGLTRRIRQGSFVAMTLWLLASIAWLALELTDAVTVPSISDVFALLFIVPGGWMLVTSVRGRLRRAEEAAVYLDNGLVFLATGAVLVALFGPTAAAIGGWEGFLVVLYPVIFLGSAVASLLGIFATGQSIRPRGGLAFGIGVGLVGLAYVGWIAPTATGIPADSHLNLLFSVGPLVAAYGAMTWGGELHMTGLRVRLARVIAWSIGPVAVLVTAIAAVTVGENRSMELFLQALAAVAVVLLLLRISLHLRERSETLEEVRRLHETNEVLVERLRHQIEESERVHARLVDASRMSAVGELAAAIAHEINNPLTGVLGYTELLLAEVPADSRMQKDLGIIRSEALRVRDRVRSLMDFATPKRPELVASDVASVISGPIGLLRYHLERRGISIEERHESMPGVDLDPPSIQQAVINVISDMAGAMPRGGRLTVSVGPAGEHARIAIEADAPEVDVAMLAAAFQPFDDDPGALPGSRRIAASIGVLRGHDATIGLRREPGEHPRVEIHLPYHARDPRPTAG